MPKVKSLARKNKLESQMSRYETHSSKAKLFQNGRSQAVRLPKEFRFEGDEIGVGKVGNAVLLYPLNDPWAVFFEGAEELANSDLLPIKRHQNQAKRSL